MQLEVEIATAEMERAQQRLMTLEREKNNLVAQVSIAVIPVTPSAIPSPGSEVFQGTNSLEKRGGYIDGMQSQALCR